MTKNSKEEKKVAYRRPEDSEQVDIQWEQRVQWEGQRNGDGFNQNEILRKNLNGF